MMMPTAQPDDTQAASPPPQASLTAAVSREVGKAGRYLGQALRLMVGLPDYDNYLTHMEATHPGVAPMSYEEFFRDRQGARYGAGRGSCC